jgi:hypothetical protein
LFSSAYEPIAYQQSDRWTLATLILHSHNYLLIWYYFKDSSAGGKPPRATNIIGMEKTRGLAGTSWLRFGKSTRSAMGFFSSFTACREELVLARESQQSVIRKNENWGFIRIIWLRLVILPCDDDRLDQKRRRRKPPAVATAPS